MFAKVIAKNRAFGNNIISYNNFPISRGGGILYVLPPPDGAYDLN